LLAEKTKKDQNYCGREVTSGQAGRKGYEEARGDKGGTKETGKKL